MNLIDARVDDGKVVAGPFALKAPDARLPAKLHAGVRPEDVRISGDGARAEIVAVEPLGAETHFVLRAGDVELRVRAPGFDTRARGDVVGVTLDDAKVLLFDAEGEGKRVA
jgi:ABC-type sugar transport system ATPase subunit